MKKDMTCSPTFTSLFCHIVHYKFKFSVVLPTAWFVIVLFYRLIF